MAKRSIKRGIKNAEKKIGEVMNDDSKLFAFIATFFSIIGFFVALIAKRRDGYVMHYAKQSLIIFMFYVLSVLAVSIPGFGWIIGPIIYVITVLMWVLSWVFAISGEHRNVPIVKEFVKYIRL